MNGFTIQETKFPYVCTIVDDSSTDGEQDVLRDYLQKNFNLEDKNVVRNEETEDYVLTFARHKSNINCYFAVLYLKYNHYSNKEIKDRKFKYIAEWHDNAKYIAWCEGDDFWTDPLKLQKQVNILEKYPDCSLVLSNGFTGINMDDNAKIINPYLEQKTGFISMHTLLLSLGGLVPTASMCYRQSLPPKPDLFYVPHIGDKPLRIWCALNGDVYYFEEPMTFYRKSGGDSFGSRVGRDKGYAKEVFMDFCNFLDRLNEYTKQKYEEEITFMKEKEEFYYLCRINDPNLYKCKYYRSPYVNYSRKQMTLLFLRCKYPTFYQSILYIYHLIKRNSH